MLLGTRLEYIRSSPRVSGVCKDSAREFTRRRLRLTERLSGVAERLAGSWKGLTTIGKRSYRLDQDQAEASDQGLDDMVGARREFARTLPKVSGRSLGTRREITEGGP
ncbi:hypothetical protein B296_00004771 [Ensete ventricosum]|uniref:Uncharacterized protein n=1 Tax=Ensete ventricosum TaxID=4639 RepID=A0A427B8Y6_ENSVE|nr:hypothetical protein B296_00004771 [Ensete ventricosum]